MNKKRLLIIPIFLIVAALLLSACQQEVSPTATSSAPPPATSSTAAPIKLLLATTDNPQGLGSYPMNIWSDELEKRSNGRVTVELSWSSSLGAESEYLSLLQSDVCDAAFLLPNNVAPGIFPRTEIMSLPWCMESAVPAEKAQIALQKAGYFDKEYSDAGLKILMILAAGGRADPLMFAKADVHEIADVKGLKIQSPGPVKTAITEAFGGVPTYATIQELYLALQKGILEGMFCPYEGLKTEKFAEVIKYVMSPGFGNLSGGIFMNMDSWNKLPPDIQKIITDMQLDLSIQAGQHSDEANQAAIDFFLQSGGKINKWSDASLTEMNTIFASIWGNFIKDWEAKGVPMKDAINLFYNTLKTEGVTPPAAGYVP